MATEVERETATVRAIVGNEERVFHDVISLSQSLGDTHCMYAICTPSRWYPAFAADGEYYEAGWSADMRCRKCREADNEKGCGQHHRVASFKSDPDLTVLCLKSGDSVYVDSIIEITNDKGDAIPW